MRISLTKHKFPIPTDLSGHEKRHEIYIETCHYGGIIFGNEEDDIILEFYFM